MCACDCMRVEGAISTRRHALSGGGIGEGVRWLLLQYVILGGLAIKGENV